ncbi:MAG: polyprenyl synthetase family protein [Candidatus Hadarchaeales archaeon]
MNIHSYVRKRLHMVEREIDRWIPKNMKPDTLARAARHLIEAGGKRLRPCLVLAACEAVGGKPGDALESAAAIEMLHNFTLIHDDIMDRDELRRNVKTVHTIWGEPMAIIAGDALFARVFEAAAENARRLGLDGARTVELLSAFSRASFEVCRGQAMDMLFEGRKDVVEKEYMEMVSKKTGALTEASARVGAILGGGSRNQVDSLSSYGRQIGIAFQIQDDVLGIIGKEEKFGKPIGSDIQEGKMTLLVIRALSVSDEKKEILRVLGNKNASREEILRTMRLIRDSGAVDYAFDTAKKIVASAKKELDTLPDTEAREFLLHLADFVIRRDF